MENDSFEELVEEVRRLKKWMTLFTMVVVLIGVYLIAPFLIDTIVFLTVVFVANPALPLVILIIIGVAISVAILIRIEKK